MCYDHNNHLNVPHDLLRSLLVYTCTCSYLNPFEFSDLEIERKYFESNPSIGKFYNKLITGTLIKPPQDDPGLIKVGVSMHARVRVVCVSYKARQTEFAVYCHRPHGFSDFLKKFHISDCIQQLYGSLAPPPRSLQLKGVTSAIASSNLVLLALFY